MSSGTIHYALGRLEERGLLEWVPKGRAETGLTIKEFHPTSNGVIAALATGKLWNNVDQIVERWGSWVPLTLKKWSHLVSYGLEEEMKRVVESTPEEILHARPAPGDERTEAFEDFVRDLFNWHVLRNVLGSRDRATRIKWYKAIRDDPELRRWALEKARLGLSKIRASVTSWERLVRLFEAAETPNWKEVEEEEARWPAVIFQI